MTPLCCPRAVELSVPACPCHPTPWMLRAGASLLSQVEQVSVWMLNPCTFQGFFGQSTFAFPSGLYQSWNVSSPSSYGTFWSVGHRQRNGEMGARLGMGNNSGTDQRTLLIFGGFVPLLAWTYRVSIPMWHQGLLSGTTSYIYTVTIFMYKISSVKGI